MRGARVHRSLMIDGTTDRAVLFSWSADPAPVKRNLVRVDQHGNVVWRAELPSKSEHDCFTDLKRDGNRLLARTFSGWNVSLDLDGNSLCVVREAAAA